jgi:energy-converting hydrogenase Eha subunit C
LLLASDRAPRKDVLHVVVMGRVILVAISEMVDVRLWRISCPAINVLILCMGFAIWILQKQNLVLIGRV